LSLHCPGDESRQARQQSQRCTGAGVSVEHHERFRSAVRKFFIIRRHSHESRQ
jgi:hypothetical protein